MINRKQKDIFLILLLSIMASAFLLSCTTLRQTGQAPEDQIFLTRKYAGNFVGYTHSSPYYNGGPKVISITTTLDSVYGPISAYSKKCNFQSGERLYIRKVYIAPGVFGNWKYQIENDGEKKVFYGIRKFNYGDKVLIQNWF